MPYKMLRVHSQNNNTLNIGLALHVFYVSGFFAFAMLPSVTKVTHRSVHEHIW